MNEVRAVVEGDTVAVGAALDAWVESGHVTWRADRHDSRRRRLQWVGAPGVPDALAGWQDGHVLEADPDRVLSHAEVARFTGVPPGTVLRWWRDGLLPEAVDGHGSPVTSKRGKPCFRAFDVMGLVLFMIAEGEGTLTVAGGDR